MGDRQQDVAARGELTGRGVPFQLVGKDLLPGVRADAIHLDFAHQADALGIDALERELLGVPAWDQLRGGGCCREAHGQRDTGESESGKDHRTLSNRQGLSG